MGTALSKMRRSAEEIVSEKPENIVSLLIEENQTICMENILKSLTGIFRVIFLRKNEV